MSNIQTKIGHWISWLCLLLVLLICTDVFFRYVFNSSKTWMIDLEWQLFSLLFLWSAGSTWLADKHVRVDLFYSNWSLKRKAFINIVGTVLFLLPWCAIIIYSSASYAWQSLRIGEGSPDPNGLGARYLIKSAIVIGYLLLGIAGVTKLLQDIRVIISNPDTKIT